MDLEALFINAKDPDSFHLPRACGRAGPTQQGRAGSPLRGKWNRGPTFQRLKELQDYYIKLIYTLGVQAPHKHPLPIPSPLLSSGKQAQRHGQFLP